MALVLTDPTTLQGMYEDVKFKSGQDSLSFEDFVRMFNMAKGDYSYIALTSSGRFNFDDSTHVDANGDPTFPIAYATLNAGETNIPLATDFLMIQEVRVDGLILTSVDRRDNRSQTYTEVYGSSGTPRAYDYNSHSLYIYPPSDIAREVEVEYLRATADSLTTDTTAAIGIPKIHFKYLSLNVRSQLNERNNDPNQNNIDNKLLMEEVKIKDYWSKVDQTGSRQLKPKYGTSMPKR